MYIIFFLIIACIWRWALGPAILEEVHRNTPSGDGRRTRAKARWVKTIARWFWGLIIVSIVLQFLSCSMLT